MKIRLAFLYLFHARRQTGEHIEAPRRAASAQNHTDCIILKATTRLDLRASRIQGPRLLPDRCHIQATSSRHQKSAHNGTAGAALNKLRFTSGAGARPPPPAPISPI
jgi:hypothetical protein